MDKSNNKNGVSFGIVLLAMVAGVVIGMLMSRSRASFSARSESQMQHKVDAVMSLIENEYVDVFESDSLEDEMINAMLNTLDPHSRYLSAESLTKEVEQIQGHFDGIGVALRRVKDTVCVQEVFENGPSSGVGLKPGDRIVTVDTVKVAEQKMSTENLIKLVRGRRNTEVDLGIVRRGVEGVGHYKIKRGVVQTPTVPYYGMLDQTTGYIKVLSFAEHTHQEFREGLMEMQGVGMKSLIIDLRGNGGGLLEAAINIANELLPKGDLIVYTNGAHQWRHDVKSQGGGLFTEGNLIVLIDESSASASEIVAGAMQDNDRGWIMGRRSFGKGLVQGQYSLNDGSALWLTTARYYTPSGRCIQRPYDHGFGEYYRSNVIQALAESFSDTINANLSDTTKYYTKNGRVVYGGGGIVPDKLLPYKRYDDIAYYNRLMDSMVVFDYSFEYLTNHIGELQQRYKSAKDFVERFHVTNQMLEEMFVLGESKGLKRDAKTIAHFDKLMRTVMKASIGQSLWGTQAYYKIMLTEDDELQEALQESKKR